MAAPSDLKTAPSDALESAADTSHKPLIYRYKIADIRVIGLGIRAAIIGCPTRAPG